MPTSLVNRICSAVEKASGLYERLVVVAGDASPEKEEAFGKAAEKLGGHRIGISRGLSRALLDMTERQRRLNAAREVTRIAKAGGDGVHFVERVGLLFLPSLQLDPLRLFQRLSRDRTIVVNWEGPVGDGLLTYARPDHAEYRRYPVTEAGILVDADTVS